MLRKKLVELYAEIYEDKGVSFGADPAERWRIKEIKGYFSSKKVFPDEIQEIQKVLAKSSVNSRDSSKAVSDEDTFKAIAKILNDAVEKNSEFKAQYEKLLNTLESEKSDHQPSRVKKS